MLRRSLAMKHAFCSSYRHDRDFAAKKEVSLHNIDERFARDASLHSILHSIDERFARRASLHSIDCEEVDFQLVRQITKAACVETATFSCIEQYTRSFVNRALIDQ